MNKNLLIGVGVMAVVGVGAFLYFRKRQTTTEEATLDLRSETLGADETTPSGVEAGNEPPDGVKPLDETLSPTTPLTPKEARQGRKQSRRDCRAEAIQKRLKGKAKREFKRECKAAGGINADFAGDEADFAFNGYTCFN
jgi:hypothetical protein